MACGSRAVCVDLTKSAWLIAGYYYNADTQMYFDNKTGGYYSGTDSKWYLYDGATQQFQEWQQVQSY